MAITHVTEQGTLIIPGAYASYKVQPSPGGLSTTGVLMFIGESDRGPHWSEEEDLESNAFGPGQAALVRAKYGSGPLVDAFDAATTPANDDQIPGSFNAAIIVKTNSSARATSFLKASDGVANYLDIDSRKLSLAASLGGKEGNLTRYRISDGQDSSSGVPLSGTQEVLPTTGDFSWCANEDTVDFAIRENGGAVTSISLAANRLPSELVSDINTAHSETPASGGSVRAITASGAITGTVALVGVATDETIALTLAGSGLALDGLAQGDVLVIYDNGGAGTIAGSGATPNTANTGSYVVTEVDSSDPASVIVYAARQSAADGAVVTTSVAVEAVSAAVVVGTDIDVFRPVKITQDLADDSVIDGVGKTLEVAELTTGNDLLSSYTFLVSAAGAISEAGWVSKSASPKLIHSGSDSAVIGSVEHQVSLQVVRGEDTDISVENIGGRIGLEIGYEGTTATISISDETLTTSVVGGSGANLSIDLADYSSLSLLAQYINGQTGYWARSQGQLAGRNPTILDNVSGVGIATQFGSVYAGRIKADGWDFANRVNSEATLVQVVDALDPLYPTRAAASGLPAVSSSSGEDWTFLSGGTRGGTSQVQFQAALDALERVSGNFVVPLFSQDAADDIAEKATDSSSTYAIDSIIAACKNHALKMSTLKRRRNRQVIGGVRKSFAAAKAKAEETASFRVALGFQDVRVALPRGITQMPPWMEAVNIAAMQAAGFTKAIFGKKVNVNGFVQSAGDFDARDQDAVESALLSGLMVGQKAEDGGYEYVSDQTTYVKDDNFVFNSIQAVYVADTIALTLARRMERAYKGKNQSDASAGSALGTLASIMRELLRLKLTAPSNGAPLGYRNARVTIQGPVMKVELEVKLNGAIYFIPISFLVSQVESSAG